MSDSQCQSLWSKAVSNGNSLSSSQANSYITDMNRADTDKDGSISQTEFNSACKLGLVQSAADSSMPSSQTR